MSLALTTTYTLPLVLIWATLWINVTAFRARAKQSIGDGANPELLLRIRRHGNFIEWTPLVLLMLLMAEAQGAGALWLHTAGILLLCGRLAHPFGLKIENGDHPLRYVGNGANLLAVAVLSLVLIRILAGI